MHVCLCVCLSVSMCMWECVCACMCACPCVCVHIYACVHVCMYACVCAHVHAYVCMTVCITVCMCVHVWLRAWPCVCECAAMCTCVCDVCTAVCVNARLCAHMSGLCALVHVCAFISAHGCVLSRSRFKRYPASPRSLGTLGETAAGSPGTAPLCPVRPRSLQHGVASASAQRMGGSCFPPRKGHGPVAPPLVRMHQAGQGPPGTRPSLPQPPGQRAVCREDVGSEQLPQTAASALLCSQRRWPPWERLLWNLLRWQSAWRTRGGREGEA